MAGPNFKVHKIGGDITEHNEIYAGIEAKILVYHSSWDFKHACFFRVISRTKKTVVVQRLNTKVVREHEIGGYQDVVPEEMAPRAYGGECLNRLKCRDLSKVLCKAARNTLNFRTAPPVGKIPCIENRFALSLINKGANHWNRTNRENGKPSH